MVEKGSMQRRIVFPFSAIVALDKLKLAILINAINPKVGGLLIRGPKGSGKTTVVRGLTDILPKITVVKDCSFNCSPSDPSNMCSKCAERYHKGEKLPTEERGMTVVNLPLGATEDRVVGSLDVEKAIKLGVEALEPGVLAQANQNILYVDEVNLLPDHIADDLLDAAATGWNVVEREGISVSHPSRFVFVGTMNPEEGELRPQLLDRFSLSVGVEKISKVEDRIEIVKRNSEFEEDPIKFCEKYKSSQKELAKRILRAREILPEVKMLGKLLEVICKTCLELKVDGMRPDIVISKAACTLAAFEYRNMVTLGDVLVASELALGHRTREGGFLEPATPDEIRETLMSKAKEIEYSEDKRMTPPPEEGQEDEEVEKEDEDSEKLLEYGPEYYAKKGAIKKGEKPSEELPPKVRKLSRPRSTLYNFLGGLISRFGKRSGETQKALVPKDEVPPDSETMMRQTLEEEGKEDMKGIPKVSSAEVPPLDEGVPLLTKIKEGGLSQSRLSFKMKKPVRGVTGSFAGKRAETVTTLHRGRARGWRFPRGKPKDVHLPATIRAAARRQKYREKPLETALKICLEDVREKSRMYRAPMTIVFVIDLSGSMVFSIKEAKEAVLKLHADAYRYRDKVGIVALKEAGAVVVQHPITNLKVVANKLLELKVSGFTPLAAGMLKALEVLKECKRRDMSTIPVMAIITDGGANVPLKKSLETGEVRTFDVADIDARKYEDKAVEDIAVVSKMIKRDGVYTVVINTNPYLSGRETYGLEVTRRIASLTNGTHHEVGKFRGEKLVKRMFEGLVLS